MFNSKQLALRDPAKAALFGIIAGASMGADSGLAAGFGDDWGDDWSGEMAGDIGGDFGGPAPAVPRPTQQQALALWNHHHRQQAVTKHRERLLRPNADSTVKIQRYTFPLNQALTLGTALNFTMSSQPDVEIRPQRLFTNAPAPFFVVFSEVKVANVAVTVGAGNSVDAYQWAGPSQGVNMDLPTILPSNKASAISAYSGYIPPGFLLGQSVTFTLTFTGPSDMAG